MGLISLYALFLPISSDFNYLYSLVGLDTIVQFVEAFVYSLFIYFNVSAKQASIIRYYDWFITTPVMLFTFVAFVYYSSKQHSILREQNNNMNNMNNMNNEYNEFYEKYIKPIKDFISHSNHKTSLFIILISNALMLLFGYLGEINIISFLNAFVIGFLFFFIEFYYIYKDFIIPYGDDNSNMYFTVFTIVWGLYGVAYAFNDTTKNIMYNILDLISKNIYGLVLSYLIYRLSISI